MYRAIVKRLAWRNFARINRDEYAAVLERFDSEVEFCFAGQHALGGELRGIESVRAWFERTFHLFPDLRLEPLAMVVAGWPWNTRVLTQFAVHATLKDGSPYRNEGVQVLRLRWGRIVEDRLYEDTQLLVQALDRLAQEGVEEARAAPLGKR